MMTAASSQAERSLPRSQPLTLQRVFRILAVMMFVGLVSFSFRAGWSRAETDFPNYYTAALLVRKGDKLSNYYNWTWFQRQMNYAGIERQLGGYIPQTPLAMLPMAPVAALPPQAAKRVWLALNLLLLAGTIWLLSRITRFSAVEVTLLALAGYGSLHMNFVLGQYYILLLFLLTLSFYCLHREHSRTGGFLMGMAFALKLYGGPFVLYFAAKRQWKAVAGMLAGAFCLGATAVAIFGWPDLIYYATQILPRALAGETLDPYNPGNGTLATLLRRAFVWEPELNPHPLWNSPWLFFFLRTSLTLGIVGFPLLFLRRSTGQKAAFAWFLIALLLSSPNTASYTFILLLLPLALLMEKADFRVRIMLLACYMALTVPMRPSWSWLFPKVWFLLAFFFLAGLNYWQRLRWQSTLILATTIIFIATLVADRSLANHFQEPGQHWERIAVEPGALYSSSPAVLRSGIVYESIYADRYALGWRHSGRIDHFTFEGQAFHPVALSPDGPIQFELVEHGASITMRFDPTTTRTVVESGPSAYREQDPAASPDGKWLAFATASSGTTQIWLRKLDEGKLIRLTGGNCNSFAPAWELDSEGILFASDCGRGIGLPALYRARLDRLPGHSPAH